MQRSEIIDISKLNDIVSSISLEPVVVYQDYSDFDSDLKKFEDVNGLIEHIEQMIANDAFSANFAIYYPEAKGYFYKEKKLVNPEKCNGATFRHVASGWGLIHLQIDFRKKPVTEFKIAANTFKRASAWETTYPELKEAELWDWKFVEKQTRRLIRVLKKSA